MASASSHLFSFSFGDGNAVSKYQWMNTSTSISEVVQYTSRWWWWKWRRRRSRRRERKDQKFVWYSLVTCITPIHRLRSHAEYAIIFDSTACIVCLRIYYCDSFPALLLKKHFLFWNIFRSVRFVSVLIRQRRIIYTFTSFSFTRGIMHNNNRMKKREVNVLYTQTIYVQYFVYIVAFDYIFTYYYYGLHATRRAYSVFSVAEQTKEKRYEYALCIYIFCVRRFINFVLDLIYCVCHGHRAKRTHTHMNIEHTRTIYTHV